MSVLFALHSWLLGGSRHIFGCRCQISNMAISFRPVSDADELTLEARSAFDPVKWQIIVDFVLNIIESVLLISYFEY